MEVAPIVVEEQLLWLAGTAGVGYYRIPLLSYTPQGSLIAVCEARKEGYADFGPKFLAIRRSTDKGALLLSYAIIQEKPETSLRATSAGES
uniref:Neuraminidase-like 1 n=1 Tax=Branchiostoma floridae TaxID=7739 RepID=Q6XA16_BRAFL|nr:neuraminidase-like 1 [Branchiostoma floridae]